MHIVLCIAARGHGRMGQLVQITETHAPHAKALHLTRVFAQLKYEMACGGGERGEGSSLENSLALRVTVWVRLLAPIPSCRPLTIHCCMDHPHFLCTRTGMVSRCVTYLGAQKGSLYMRKDEGGPPCNWTGSSCSPPALEAKEPWCVRRLPWSPGPVQGAEMGKGGTGGTRGNVTRAHQEMERGIEAVRRGSATVEKRRAQSIQPPAAVQVNRCKHTVGRDTTRLVALRAKEDWGQG